MHPISAISEMWGAKPLTLDHYAFGNVDILNKSFLMSPLGKVSFFTQWEEGHQLSEAGEGPERKGSQ